MRLTLLILLASCAHFDGTVYRNGAVAFRVGGLPAGWQRIHSAAAVAYHHPDGGTISVDASCERADDVSLDVLTNHLLIGFENRAERPRRAIALDGRAALRTQADATLDGVFVGLDLVVLKKNGCIYDLQLIASRVTVERRRADFERFVAQFAEIPR